MGLADTFWMALRTSMRLPPSASSGDTKESGLV